MYMWKVTMIAKKSWGDPLEMSWITIADTNYGAIESVVDDLDLTGVTVDKVIAEKLDRPYCCHIKE
jgi:hypothetical protein